MTEASNTEIVTMYQPAMLTVAAPVVPLIDRSGVQYWVVVKNGPSDWLPPEVITVVVAFLDCLSPEPITDVALNTMPTPAHTAKESAPVAPKVTPPDPPTESPNASD